MQWPVGGDRDHADADSVWRIPLAIGDSESHSVFKVARQNIILVIKTGRPAICGFENLKPKFTKTGR